MMGLPKNVRGQCNARLEIGDDYGENCCTMRCQLKPKHKGPHQETWDPDGDPSQIATVTWGKRLFEGKPHKLHPTRGCK